jgi:hypothetical protein
MSTWGPLGEPLAHDAVLNEFWMLDPSPLSSRATIPTAVGWEMKRTCTLTGGKGCKLEQVQAMLMPGSKMEAAEEGACVQTFCTQLTGLEMWKCRSSVLLNSPESSVLGADFKPQGHLKKYMPGLFSAFPHFWFQVRCS